MSSSSHNRELTASRGGTGTASTPANNVSGEIKTEEVVTGTLAETAPSKPVQKNKCVLLPSNQGTHRLLTDNIRVVTHLPQDVMGNRMKKELKRKSNLDKKNYFWGMTGATLKKAAKAEQLELNAQL